MIPILIGIGIVVLIAKSRSDAMSSPTLENTGGGLSHTYATPRTNYVTERMAPWGSQDQFNFIRTTNPSLPTDGGQPSPIYPAAVSNIRIGRIARVAGGGGSFQ